MIATSNKVLVASLYAISHHEMTNHRYDGEPYSVHLQAVYDYALKYSHLLRPDLRELAFAACWVHDVIEDTRQTYSDVKGVCGEDVAEIAYLLTNNKGRNRSERENDSYYTKIRSDDVATFVKICDRLANAAHSENTDSRKLDMYKSEHKRFCAHLRHDMFEEMFKELDEILMPEKIAMQHRCIYCGREQYAPAVWPISQGKHPCVWCGKTPPAMTETEYGKELIKLKNKP